MRCHPNYRDNGPWHDWGLIHFEIRNLNGNITSREEVPAKFCCWINIPDEGPQAIMKVCSKRLHDKSSAITQQWSYPMLNLAFEGLFWFHCIKRSDYIRATYVIEKDNNEDVIVIDPYLTWYQNF